LTVEQITRLTKALVRRVFETDILHAKLQQLAISRSLAGVLGDGRALPPWPTWDNIETRQERELPPLMKRMRGNIFSDDE